MASHFQVPTERLSYNDLAEGFSFDARPANKQGQFSGPTPKSIIPGVQPASQKVAALPAKSATQRLKLPFPGLDFTSNLERDTARPLGPDAGVNDQAQGSANGNASVSSHFSHGSDHGGAEGGNSIHSADNTLDGREQSVQVEIQRCSPPPLRCNKQNLVPSPMERQNRPSSGANKDTSDTAESNVRNNNRYKEGRYFQRGYSQSRTPPPRCGDLEGFGIYEASTATRTPPSHVRGIHRGQSRTRSFDIEGSIPRRTHSRASNISRKRRFGPTDHQTSEPDRKRLAMSEAVKHWNECMEIATEETDRARSTVHNLKKKLQRQAHELQAAKDAQQTGDTSLQKLQKQYQDLQTQGNRASEDKKDLEFKFNELSVDYDKLRSQVKEMSTKYSSCEGKLEGAISEQRELFNKSKHFYVNLNNQMKQDEARGKANAEAVEHALQTSKQKRDELKKIVEHIQRDFQQQKSEYEHKIRSLEKENESQCDQMDAIEEDKERFYSEMVSNRSTKACIESVSSQLSGFVTQLRALDASQDTAAIELRNLKTKVDDLPDSHDLLELKEQISGSHTKISDLERLVRESILPAIGSIASKQSESQASMNSLTSAVEGGLTKLQEQIQTHAINLGKTIKNSNQSQAEVFNLLTLMSAANGDVSSRVEVANSRLENLVEGVSSQGILGTRIATILEAAQGLFESNEKIVSAQEKAQEDAQQLHEVLARKIDANSLSHGAASQELVSDLKKHFEASLAALKANLLPENSRPVNSSKSTLMSSKMLQDVEAVRSNLQQVESQLAKIDDVPMSLQKIYDLSLLIQETSKYMDKEEQWVHETMANRVLQSDESGTTDKSASQTTSSQSSASSDTGFGFGSQESPGEDACESQVRKVVVHSPRLDGEMPLRVTTAQEQRRRRESAKPRSILKQSQNKSGAAKTLVAPVRSNFNTSEEVIADIRSTLVQSPPGGSSSSHRTIGLTPMTEYLKLNKATNTRPGVVLGDLADAELAVGNNATAAGITTTV